ncbi:segregation/condensation protein A [Streptomyces sp. NPDC089799]|uniref:segregation and condensation protein A n=1 Tax=Streptomyces sp. NPDC089799 TaxID=3155066 RepID=UPI00343335B8
MPPNDPARPAAARRRLGRGPGVPAAPARAEGDLPGPAPLQGGGDASGAPEGADAPAAAPAVLPAGEGSGGAPAGTAVADVGPEGTGTGLQTAPGEDPARGSAAPDAGARPTAVDAPEAGPDPAPEPTAEPGPAPEAGPASMPPPAAAIPPRDASASRDGKFTLRLANFEGPFDLLLQLISRHKLDVTEVALSKVTDEFMAHIRAMGPDWDLDQTTEFLVVAATLLDLKAARLLPAAEVEDEADLALLEARDLLFARLLQYRAYKQIAGIFEGRAEAEARRYPRTVGLEPHHAELLPEVVIGIGAEGFARLAAKAMRPRPEPQVYVDHIHAPLVSVQEQAEVVVRVLRTRGEATFAELTEDAPDTLTVVARFLALLELYRERAVELDQEEALQVLTVRWSGGDGGPPSAVTDEFDQVVEETG